MPLCDYGCGQEAQHYLTKVKKHCCAKHPRNCPEYRKVIAARTTDQMNKATGLTPEQRHAAEKQRRAERQKARVEAGKTLPVPLGQLCDYGCGQPAQHRLRPLVKDEQGTRFVWKWCCSPNYRQCPVAQAEARVKQKATTKERLGVENHQQSPHSRQRFVQTCQVRYGVDAPALRPEHAQLRREGCMARYGVPHETHIPGHLQKLRTLRHLFKDYTLPSGRVLRLQGYEPQAVTALLRTYPEAALDFDNIPSLPYNDPDGDLRFYHPDIYIPSDNLIIEVKSWWTLRENYEINRLKQLATLAAGYRFQFWVKDNRARVFDIIDEVLPDFATL